MSRSSVGLVTAGAVAPDHKSATVVGEHAFNGAEPPRAVWGLLQRDGGHRLALCHIAELGIVPPLCGHLDNAQAQQPVEGLDEVNRDLAAFVGPRTLDLKAVGGRIEEGGQV